MTDEQRAGYERLALAELRSPLLDPPCEYRTIHHGRVQHARIESVELDDSEPEHAFAVRMRDLERPERLFEWRKPAFDSREDAKEYAGLVRIHLEEDVEAIGYGLLRECSPGGIAPF